MSKQSENFQSDPSMDDILSSIRNIISDDVKQAAVSSKEISANSNKAEEDDVLNLTEMIKDDGSVVSIQRGEPSFEEAKTKETTEVPKLTQAEGTPLSEEKTEFISDEALSESVEALQGLDRISDDALQAVGRKFDGSKPLELLIVDVLRPMLKEWIDSNLPSLVKVIVNEQVERVMQSRIGNAANQEVAGGRTFEEELRVTEGELTETFG